MDQLTNMEYIEYTSNEVQIGEDWFWRNVHYNKNKVINGTGARTISPSNASHLASITHCERWVPRVQDIS